MKTNDILMDACLSRIKGFEEVNYEIDSAFFSLGTEIDELFALLPRENSYAPQVARLHALVRTHLEVALLYCEKAVRVSHLED